MKDRDKQELEALREYYKLSEECGLHEARLEALSLLIEQMQTEKEEQE